MEKKPSKLSQGAQLGIIIGGVLIFFGIINLLQRFFGSFWWDNFRAVFGTVWSFAWPIALIGAGLYLVWAARKGKFKNIGFDSSRPLRRSVVDKRIAGVCGGIAAYLNIDPTIVRILAVIFLVLSFWITLIVYLIAAVLIPKA